MAITLSRKEIYFRPYLDRVLARRFDLGEERSIKIIKRVLTLTDTQQTDVLNQILRNYAKRHRSMISILERNFSFKESLLKKMDINKADLNDKIRLIIGAYFTMEYSIEAAAFFNPSIVLSPDQTQLGPKEKRLIFSFRAVGEGHISSIVFRSAIIDENMNIKLEEIGNLLDKPKHVKSHSYKKGEFIEKLLQLHQPEDDVLRLVEDKLTDTFTYDELNRYVKEIKLENQLDHDALILMQQIMWLASSHYEVTFSLDTAISERVIFPVSDTEKNGIEDARFVRFISSSGRITYYATYTAYDGFSILPKLLSTKDFLNFKIQPINGKITNKGSAIFPRKINGKFAMICRIDGENNYITFSDSINNWQQEMTLLTQPEYPWEFVQMGNCGSPLETDRGWLVILHSVGPMREYTLGAMLLDLNDPTIVLGKLQEPMMYPTHKERNGYVPNVVYSCGQIIHEGHLVIPYGFSDHESTYATIPLEELLEELLPLKKG